MGEKENEYFGFETRGDLQPPSKHPIIEELRAQIRRKGKIVTGEQAAAIIRDGDVVTTGGFVATGVPEDILICMEERFKKEGHPLNLTLIYAAGQGDGKTRALNHLGHEGLVGRVIGGHIGLAPMLQKLIREEKILAYNMPQIGLTIQPRTQGPPRTNTHQKKAAQSIKETHTDFHTGQFH